MLPLSLLGCPWIPAEGPDTGPTCDQPVYRDDDADGFGNPDAPGDDGACPDEGWVTNADDCDDGDAAITENTWYEDADGDTYGNPDIFLTVCANPGVYVSDATDCDDHDGAINPGVAEICDGADNDCDNLTDDADDGVDVSTGSTFYADVDADTFGDPDSPIEACDQPTGTVVDDTDCNDTSALAHPDLDEVCDDLDNDCDGTIDIGAIDEPLWYADTDGDSYGDASSSESGCTAPAAHVADDTDCDDADPTYHPGADESDCTDPNDYNCDGSTGYEDSDADGSPACEDCDDANPAALPGGSEVCDGADNDCNSVVDDNAPDATSWYSDVDNDTFGDPATGVLSCTAPAGTVADDTDCNDADAAYNPAADESDCADPNDYNFDGSSGSVDAVGDGALACEECDDTSALSFPGAVEVCDGVDNDCVGGVDVDAADAQTFYADVDGDGYGDDATGVSGCEGAVTVGGDCDDNDAGYNPGIAELCTDTVDYDCDGSVGFDDLDEDGTAACEDCDDGDATAFPGNDEVCDGVDNDCDGGVDVDATDAGDWYADVDGDGFGDAADLTVACDAPESTVEDGTDCDDSDAANFPGGAEVCDQQDNNCDASADEDLHGMWYYDLDEDGFGDPDSYDTGCTQSPGTVADGSDCDDGDAGSYPGGVEVCDLLDNDCNDAVDDNAGDASPWYADTDGDGFGDADASVLACEDGEGSGPDGYVSDMEDCDDGDESIYPQTWYADTDGDGFGDPAAPVTMCLAEDGFVLEGTDCDDGDGALHEDGDGDGVCDTAGFTDYTTTYGSLMVAIPAGTFCMGCGAADTEETYIDHEVTLTHDLWMGETEITRGQWESWSGGVGWDYTSIAAGNACTSSTTTADCPADSISWHAVAMYANALSAAEGLRECYLSDGTDLAAAYLTNPYACDGYRMPTEAEWEYAARAGEDTRYSGSDSINEVAWNYYNAYVVYTYAHEVGTLAPNAFGLYDMSGNVWEWTNDWFDASYGGYGTGASASDPPGPAGGTFRAVRGSGWANGYASSGPIAFRSYDAPDRLDDYVLGARLARTSFSPSAPSTPTILLSPTAPTPDDDLTCTATSTDPEGDAVTYTYAWTVDGAASTITTDTIPAGTTSAGELWTCSTTASDGTASSAAGTASVTIAEAFTDYTTTYGSLMIAIPAGTFTMGGGAADTENSYIDHEVTLTHDFWIGETEITRGQLEMASGYSGWTYTSLPDYPCTTSTTTADCPADSISWYDVAMYANALSTAEGLANCYLSDGTDLAAAYLTDPYSCPGYRMPTEAEWEYAARAGEDTRCSGSDTCEDVSWQYENAYSVGTYAHDVATLAPNAWGLYDMSGNLYEWANDWYDSAHGGYADGSSDVDPAGPVTGSGEGYEGSYRVIRGGSWAAYLSNSRVAFRSYSLPSNRYNDIGGRLSRSFLDP